MGPTVTLSGANTATPSFTAPTGPATLTFQLTVTDNDGATDTDTVVVNVEPPPPVVDATGTVIVNGPTSTRKTSKAFVVEVRNTGTAPLTVLSTNIDADRHRQRLAVGRGHRGPGDEDAEPGCQVPVQGDLELHRPHGGCHG